MKFLVRTFVVWLPLAVAITGICGLIYMTVQQNYRQSLNDPQIQMAEDAARALAQGASPASLVPQTKIDIGVSLAAYMIVYDENEKPIAWSGTLDGTAPSPPPGTFEYVRTNGARGEPGELGSFLYASHGEDRLTWEPRPGVRTAIVIDHVPGGGGFVLAGRNMREVESREGKLSLMVLAAWLVTLIATFFATLLARYFS